MIDKNIKIASFSLLIATILGSLMLCNPFSKEKMSKLERKTNNKIIEMQAPKRYISKEDVLKLQRTGPNTYYNPVTNFDYIIDINTLELLGSAPREPTYLPPKTF